MNNEVFKFLGLKLINIIGCINNGENVTSFISNQLSKRKMKNSLFMIKKRVS